MKNRVTHYSPSAYKIMPWKNGAGSTTELLISPKGASVQSGFDWRISLAQVASSGPFSSFPGYLRTIMLLRGDPMRLRHQDQGEHFLESFQPYDFHGAWQTEGILTGQPVEDFNVMVRDGYGHAQVNVQNGSENPIFSLQNAPIHYIYCYQGSFTIKMQNQKHQLPEQESIMIEDSCDLSLHADSMISTAIIVSISRAAI